MFALLPSPSWPSVFIPQHITPPRLSSAHVWWSPAAKAKVWTPNAKSKTQTCNHKIACIASMCTLIFPKVVITRYRIIPNKHYFFWESFRIGCNLRPVPLLAETWKCQCSQPRAVHCHCCPSTSLHQILRSRKCVHVQQQQQMHSFLVRALGFVINQLIISKNVAVLINSRRSKTWTQVYWSWW